jgi:hypothetical protein
MRSQRTDRPASVPWIRLGVHVIVDPYQLGNPIAADPNYLSAPIPSPLGVDAADGEQRECRREKAAINQGSTLVGCPKATKRLFEAAIQPATTMELPSLTDRNSAMATPAAVEEAKVMPPRR